MNTYSFIKTIASAMVVGGLTITGFAAEAGGGGEWKPLFNGKNLDGLYVFIKGQPKSEDTNHLVQIEDGAFHFYKDAPEDSDQVAGYVATEKEYANYRVRVEYKWGTKRFATRTKAPRDSGLLYHFFGEDKIWPDSVECQIQQNDVGDIYAIATSVTTPCDPNTTNYYTSITTNRAGIVRTNHDVKPMFLDEGGKFTRNAAKGQSLRFIRNPVNEHEGWNTLEIEVHGNNATHIVNGKINNRALDIKQIVNGEWVPLTKGKILLQLEFAEVYYRNFEIQELKE